MSATTTIARTPADVFAFVADVANDVKWRTGVTDAGLSTEPPLALGSEGYARAGKTVTTWKVVDFAEPTAVAWELTSGPFAGNGGYQLEPAGDHTRFTLVADVTPEGWYRFLGPLFQRMGRRQNKADVEQLRVLLETST